MAMERILAWTGRTKSFVTDIFGTLYISLVACQCLTAQCPDGDLEISRQTQLDSFAIVYPDCEVLRHELLIIGSNIRNVDALSNVKEAYGGLLISQCDSLDNINGLRSFERILLGRLWIQSNADLDFRAFDNLVAAGKISLAIDGVDTLRGFGNLESMEGSLTISSGSIKANHAFKRLRHIGSQLNCGFPQAQNIGFDSLLSCNSFQVNATSVLTSFENMHPDFKCNDISLRFCSQLRDLAFMRGMDSVERVYFSRLDALPDLKDMADLQHIELLDLTDMPVLNLSDLESLQSIDELHIRLNDRIQRLTPLSRDCDLGGLYIFRCDSINDVSAFDVVDTDDMDYLDFSDNPLLSACSSPWVCRHIERGGTTTLGGNAPGCNSQAEVLAACTTSSTDDEQPVSGAIYPNPARDFLYLPEGYTAGADASIVGSDGQVHLVIAAGDHTVDISGLTAGRYILISHDKAGITRHPFLKL